jgi:hypothetical protein
MPLRCLLRCVGWSVMHGGQEAFSLDAVASRVFVFEFFSTSAIKSLKMHFRI